MALDATAGGASANSYATVSEGDSYHNAHLYATDWTGASSPDKEKALQMATRLLDERVSWDGAKETSTQALRWPRSGVTDLDGYSIAAGVVPQEIKNATIEFARNLIATDTTGNADGKGLTSMSVGSISMTFDKADTADVLPSIVQEMLRGWGTVNTRSKFGSVAVVRS